MGPNEVWHVDGWMASPEKLWLKCGKSNSDPGIIAQNYMQWVAEFGDAQTGAQKN